MGDLQYLLRSSFWGETPQKLKNAITLFCLFKLSKNKKGHIKTKFQSHQMVNFFSFTF
jgi:hypothetical protein